MALVADGVKPPLTHSSILTHILEWCPENQVNQLVRANIGSVWTNGQLLARLCVSESGPHTPLIHTWAIKNELLPDMKVKCLLKYEWSEWEIPAVASWCLFVYLTYPVFIYSVFVLPRTSHSQTHSGDTCQASSIPPPPPHPLISWSYCIYHYFLWIFLGSHDSFSHTQYTSV